ncbi:MAG: amidohydrolase family protein [Planctomycetota bacterium]|nr:amidohydrolase family protein [Planctomycetota bacterium]
MFTRDSSVVFALAIGMATWSVANGQPSSGGDSVSALSQLKVTKTNLERAAFPVVDVHTHFFVKGKHNAELLKEYVAMMDRNHIAICVSLDATLLKRVDEHCSFLWSEYRDRFVVFGNIDFQGDGQAGVPETWSCNQADFVRKIVEQLKVCKGKGQISGLKFFKDFGLRYRNADGSLIAMDDPRWDPIWAICGELGLPVIMHTADPGAFFEPVTPANERFFELNVHPDWSFASPDFPSRKELHEARNRIIAKHPKTTFIAAHFGNDAENLAELDGWLQAYPNLVVEFASRINELGRQPYTARRFFDRHQDRILFGTDGPWPEARLRLYWRFLESMDEYFEYSEKHPRPQGDWQIYGLGLPPKILEKVYHGNAARIIPGVQEKLAKFQNRTR